MGTWAKRSAAMAKSKQLCDALPPHFVYFAKDLSEQLCLLSIFLADPGVADPAEIREFLNSRCQIPELTRNDPQTMARMESWFGATNTVCTVAVVYKMLGGDEGS